MARPLSELSDSELLAVSSGAPPLADLSDDDLAGLAVQQGYLQPEQAQAALVEKRRAERAPVAAAVAPAMMPQVPAPIARAVLTAGGRVGDIAAEVVTPIVGAIAGAPAGLPGVAAGGAAGGAAGNVVAQTRQFFRGEREQGSAGELAAATITSGIPLGGQLLKTPARVIATRAAQGAGIAAVGDTARQVIDDGEVNFGQLAQAGAFGALFGAGAGAVESGLTRKAVLRAVRATPEFAGFDGTDAELVDAVRKRMAEAEPAPAAPAPEKNVTPGAEPAPAAAAPERPPGTVRTAAEVTADAPPLSQLTDDELLSVAQRTPAAPAPELPAALPGLPAADDAAAAVRPLADLSDDELRAQANRAAVNPDAFRIPPLAELPRLSNAELKTLEDLIVDRSTGPAEIVPTGREAAPGPRPRFGVRADEVTDIIDAIQETGGVPRAPAAEPGAQRGGEWDGHDEVFRGPAKILLSQSTGALDTYLEELAGAFPQFDRVRGNPDGFRAEVLTALRERTQAKAMTAQQANTEKFLRAALDGKGRAPKEPRAGDPIPTDALNVGAKATVKGELVTVTDVDPDGRVTLQDGPRFGTQVLPPGALFHPDAGSYQPVADLSPDAVGFDVAPDSAPNAPAVAAAPSPEFDAAVREQMAILQSLPEGAMQASASGLMLKAPLQAKIARLDELGRQFGQQALIERSLDFQSQEVQAKRAAARAAKAAPASVAPAPAGDLFGDVPFNLASEEQRPAAAPVAPMEQTAEMFGAEVRSTAPTKLDRINAAARESSGEKIGARARVMQAQAMLRANEEIVKTGKWPNGKTVTKQERANIKAENADYRRYLESLGEPESVTPASRSGGIASASPGRPAAAIEGTAPPPPTEPTALADDPAFSQLPLQLPEMVQFFKMISAGKVPTIVEKIRVLRGTALGVFRAREGNVDSGRIELRADLFQLLSVAEKHKLLGDAVAWATLMKQANPGLNFKEAVTNKFHELVKQAEAEAMQKDPKRALDVFAHEIGHYVDFLTDATLTRGNILGRIASLKRYLKGFIGENPGITNQPPTEGERAKLKRQAQRELEASVKEITETIRREVPIYKEVPITADQITSILKQAQRDEFPELYDWFSRLDRGDKVAVLKQAMKGIVDERAARFAARQQVGTKIEEETVTRRVGTEPTPEAILARYDELLRAELKRRGLISQKDVRRELEASIAWWHGQETMPEYFKTSEELYAETFSILLNNPAALAKRAPTFYRAFFQYLERKPAVKAAYEQVQNDIRSGAIQQQRVQNLRGAFQADEESGQLQDLAGAQMNWRKVRDTLRLLFDRQHGPIEARALRRLDRPESKRVLGALKDYLYRMTAVEGYARDLNQRVESVLAGANLRHDDLAEFMFHRRIVGGDRKELANAQGWSPNTSAARLAEMERDLGAERFAALDTAQQANRRIYETRVVDLLERADVLTPELLTLIRERTLYATFAKAREFNPLEHDTIEGLLEARYGKDVTAKIYRQIGYLGDIRSPYLAMTQKAFALINLAYKQMALKSLVSFLAANDPHLIAEAETVFTGKGWVPRVVDSPKVGTLLVLEKGVVKGYYVPREIAETMEHGSALEGMIVGLAHRALTWPKALLTELNAGFWPVAFAKDMATLGLQLPRGLKAFKNVPAAYGAAKASFTGAPNPLADEALRRLMVISRADPRGEHLGAPDEMTRLLLRMGQNPALWDAEAAKISRVMRAWMWWKRQGATLERTVKISGMMHLDSPEFATMPEWMKKRMVNELAGSPDFLERGRAAPIVELAGGPIFYNAWLQGMRGFKRAAQANPREFWTKFLAFFGLPAAALYAFEKGYLDMGMAPDEAEDHRNQLRSIPERDKLRGFVIPMGWADKAQGKVAYLVLPFPDQVRYLNAGLRKSLQTAGGDKTAAEGFGSVVQFSGQDLPGQNPMIAEAKKWWQFHALGQNPYDAFRNGPSLDADVFASGQGGAELAKQSFGNLTGGIVYKHKPNRAGESKTGTEKFLDLPMVSNLLGRWVRVSNAGLNEEATRITAPVARREAGLRLIADEMARKTMESIPWSETEIKLSQNEPYLTGYLVDRLGTLMKNASGPELRAFQRASSPEQKAALLDAWAKREKAAADRAKAAK